MKQFIVFISILCLYSSLFAQQDQITGEGEDLSIALEQAFTHVDFSEVTTGLLLDKSIQLADPHFFNGELSDTNLVHFDIFNMLYLTVRCWNKI